MIWQQRPEFILFQLCGVKKQLRQLAQEKENVKDSGTGIQMILYIAYCILPAPNSKASCSYLPPPPLPFHPSGLQDVHSLNLLTSHKAAWQSAFCAEKRSPIQPRHSINLEGTAVRYTFLYLLSKWGSLKIAKGVQRYPPSPVLFVKNCSQGQAVSLLIGLPSYIPEPVLLVDLMSYSQCHPSSLFAD